MKIRLTFKNKTEKEAAIKVLSDSFNLINVSKKYKNRDNDSFRVYVDAELKKEDH